MSLLPTSQCCRAARRRLRPASRPRSRPDAVWITDSLLSAAIDRYLAVSIAAARCHVRHGSHVPGPMEQRKRMAKRHMGELHFGHSHASPPIWELANLVDLTQWKWKPPAPSPLRTPSMQPRAARPRPRQSLRQSLAAVILHTLNTMFPSVFPASGSSSPSTPTLVTSPCILDTMRSHSVEPTIRQAAASRPVDSDLLPPGVTLGGVADIPHTLDHDEALSLGITDAGLTLLWTEVFASKTNKPLLFFCQAPASNPIFETHMPLFAKFCASWRSALAEGRFRNDVVCRILNSLILGMRGHGYAQHLLTEATIQGLAQWQARGLKPFDHVAWNGVLSNIAAVEKNTLSLCAQVLDRVPVQHLAAIRSGILTCLEESFVALSRSTTSRHAAAAQQGAKLSVEMLRRPEVHRVLPDITYKVLKFTTLKFVKAPDSHRHGEDYRQLRFSWLQCMARLRNVDDTYLAQTCLILEPPYDAIPLLTQKDICHLFLTWTNRQSPLAQGESLFARCRSVKGNKSFECASNLLWTTDQFFRVKAFARFLHLVHRHQYIHKFPELVCNFYEEKKRSFRHLADLALEMDRPQTAIDILCLEETKRQSEKSADANIWTTAYGIEALERLIWTPRLAHHRIWHAFNIYPQDRRRKRRRTLTQEEISRTTAIAVVMGSSPYISKRQAFELMVYCYKYLVSYGARLPKYFLRNFFNTAARHMVNAEPGITQRIVYALRIIDNYAGPEEASRIAALVVRRRDEMKSAECHHPSAPRRSY
ncbi:hypothetical protein F5Y18DRAFT_138239 [Xylariaceae sp. FL1019]|nr:hypothetical protein F5Y18DRAFT_138239 [Xylariaceae sp. FL1019]